MKGKIVAFNGGQGVIENYSLHYLVIRIIKGNPNNIPKCHIMKIDGKEYRYDVREIKDNRIKIYMY